MAARNALPVGTERQESDGYWIVKQPDHPLAYATGGRKGWVFRHRMMLFDHVNGRQQRCVYCEYSLPWQGGWKNSINVDHFNEIKGDDRIENLHPSCYWCNLLKSGWPLTFEEHWRAIQQYGHIAPVDRPRPHPLLGEEWGIGWIDVSHNLELNRAQRTTAGAL
jgi:hypothetical protein